MKWFRFYSEALHDPKVQKLQPALFKAWINVLCIANDQPERGTLPPIEDIAFAMRVSKSRAQSFLRELVKAGLVDEFEFGYRPHGWNKRQPSSDNATERMANNRRTKTEHVRPRSEESRSEENRGECVQNTDVPNTDTATPVREIAWALLSRMPAKYQRDPATLDEAESLAKTLLRDHTTTEAANQALNDAMQAFREDGKGLPFPNLLRRYLAQAEKSDWRSRVPNLIRTGGET